jgi:hypothetical protein
VDIAAYLLISLLLVGLALLTVTRISDVEFASQLWVAFLTSCVLIVWVIQSFWSHARKSSLVLFCFALLILQVALYVATFKMFGRMTVIPAVLLTVLESALVWWMGNKILARRKSS